MRAMAIVGMMAASDVFATIAALTHVQNKRRCVPKKCRERHKLESHLNLFVVRHKGKVAGRAVAVDQRQLFDLSVEGSRRFA